MIRHEFVFYICSYAITIRTRVDKPAEGGLRQEKSRLSNRHLCLTIGNHIECLFLINRV